MLLLKTIVFEVQECSAAIVNSAKGQIVQIVQIVHIMQVAQIVQMVSLVQIVQ